MASCAVKWCGKSSKTSNYKKDSITFHRYGHLIAPPSHVLLFSQRVAATKSKNTPIAYTHNFPTCPERKEKWIDATSRGYQWFPTKHSVICSRHFTEDNFHAMKDRRRLLDSAIPTLYLPILAPTPITSMEIAAKDTDIPVADTSSEQAIGDSANQDTQIPLSPGSKRHSLDTPTKQNRKCAPIPNSPSAFNTLENKRLCRRIIELTNMVKKKDKKIKKLSDANRRLKQKMASLKSSLNLEDHDG